VLVTGIEAKLNYNEAYHPIHRIRLILISCMIAVLAFGIFASYFLARYFTHKIIELNRTAAALAGGDMDARVPERRSWFKDEVSEVRGCTNAGHLSRPTNEFVRRHAHEGPENSRLYNETLDRSTETGRVDWKSW
jgi:HAMP domain-containing protein